MRFNFKISELMYSQDEFVSVLLGHFMFNPCIISCFNSCLIHGPLLNSVWELCNSHITRVTL